jgi:hypothetical protein
MMLPASLLTASLTRLETALQLELASAYFTRSSTQDSEAQQLARLLEWAGQRSQLRWLMLTLRSLERGPAEQKLVSEACQKNPGLAVKVFTRAPAPREAALEAARLVPDLAELVLHLSAQPS